MTEEYAHAYEGSCHCGNLRFELYSNRIVDDFTPRACQCTLCRRHGASWIADPGGSLVVYDSADVSCYRFGHETADFIICPRCGVLTVVLCEIDDQMRAVVNIKSMLDHVFPATETAVNFDGETDEERLARRKKNWTGEVVFSSKNVE